MNDYNRPRVVWKNGKCVICRTENNGMASDNGAKTAVKSRNDGTANVSAVVKKAAVGKRTAVENKAAVANKAAFENADVGALQNGNRELKYGRFGRNARGSLASKKVYIVISAVLLCTVIAVLLLTLGAVKEMPIESNIPDLNGASTVNTVPEITNTTPTQDNGKAALFRERGYAVCIDPGHGYDDVGTSNEELGVYEHEVVMRVALKLRDKLKADGIKVYMTHEDNIIPEDAPADKQYLFGMKKRNAFANSLSDADLFISIHCDSFFEDTTVDGARIYYMDYDKGGQAVASKFAEIFEPDEDAREHVLKSMSLSYSYQVLRESEIPAVLVETGFVSNPEEARAMLTDEWVGDMAEMISQAIVSAFEEEAIG